MAKDNIYNDDDRQYLQMMQSNIERMASNSANCKTWLITIVSGFLAIGCNVTALNGWILITLVPIIMFWYLDGYYLSLERGFRNREKDFLNKVNSEGDDYKNALYNFKQFSKKKINEGELQKGLIKTTGLWKSKSVLSFYLSIFVIVVVITIILNWAFICSCL